MQPRNPEYAQQVAELFRQAAFVMDVGYELVSITPGRVATRLAVKPRHLQQDSVIHMGVQATMADHTAGAAAGSLIAADQLVLTTGFTMNLLQAAVGEELRCRAQVLRAGRTLSVVESEVFAVARGEETLVSKATVTLAVLPRKR
ncbi:PaaI family thioesterase [Archangium violaceum]|uniref:Medium/long-chain acyl-CoA thioesterase YigI n=1 Tax=Archangium violaceum Cb vi76 TaxID=1406225 RepID=A0A084SX59_9BACT|nr:PaaI family thioesterase [Archangium violaceum]KFA93044.1 phenylacetic acid degradation protein PaaI [Archangium violaceum Cb vi76]